MRHNLIVYDHIEENTLCENTHSLLLSNPTLNISSTQFHGAITYPNTPLKGACVYIGCKRTNPMNRTNYKSFYVEYHLFYFYLFCVYRRILSHQNRVNLSGVLRTNQTKIE